MKCKITMGYLNFLIGNSERGIVPHVFQRRVIYGTLNQTVYVIMRKCGATVQMHIKPPFAHAVNCSRDCHDCYGYFSLVKGGISTPLLPIGFGEVETE